jgi:transcription termination factor Rho
VSVFDQASLEASSLADLHAIASELSIDGYRRLRKPELVKVILERQSGEAEAEEEEAETPQERPARRRRGPRRRRGEPAPASEDAHTEDQPADEGPPPEEDQTVEGVVELLPGGSGFVRLSPPEPSDDDVYISGAQVRRCELVSGDRISGPRRPPRRSERFASLVRIDTVNGRPASELADGPRFDELPAAFPTERLRLGSDDPTIKAIEWLAPIGRGSRVSIVGPPRAGKTEALRRLAAELAGQEDLQLWLVLAGSRPEETPDWAAALEPAAVAPLGSSLENRSQAVEVVIEQVRRLVARGAHAVVLIDSLDAVQDHAAARALSSARNVVDGGSLTVIGTAAAPRGGETTVIALDAVLTGAGRFPALDLVDSWTMRPELLVGDAAAEAIFRARAEALE